MLHVAFMEAEIKPIQVQALKTKPNKAYNKASIKLHPFFSLSIYLSLKIFPHTIVIYLFLPSIPIPSMFICPPYFLA